MRLWNYGAILAAMCLPLDAYAADGERFIPDCAGAVEIAHASIARVEADGTLILPDGRVLVLEGIRLAEPHRGEALAALRVLASRGPVNFTAPAPARDRYGRMRVQAFGRHWLQAALLEKENAGRVFFGEHELARSMIQHVLQRYTAGPQERH